MIASLFSYRRILSLALAASLASSGIPLHADPVDYSAEDNLIILYGQSNSVETGGGHAGHRLDNPLAMPSPTTQSLIASDARFKSIQVPRAPETYGHFNDLIKDYEAYLAGGAYAPAPTLAMMAGPDVIQAFAPGSRERSSTALAYWFKNKGMFAGVNSVVFDQPGRAGANITRLDRGTIPFLVMIQNARNFLQHAQTNGKTARVPAMFLKAGETAVTADYADADAYAEDLTRFVLDIRRDSALATLSGEDGPFPVFSLQISTHPLYKKEDNPHAVAPIWGQMTAMQSINRYYLSHPAYIHTYYDDVHLDAYGHRHAGLMFGKVFRRWVVSGGAWKPLHMTQAQRNAQNEILVTFHVPVPPLQISTSLVAETADQCHGLEVWSRDVNGVETRYTPQANPAVVSNNQILLKPLANAPWPSTGTLFVRTGFSGEYTGGTPTLAADGKKYSNWRNGPQKGARTTICDSDTLNFNAPTGSDSLPLDQNGNPYDLRNYCLLSELLVDDPSGPLELVHPAPSVWTDDFIGFTANDWIIDYRVTNSGSPSPTLQHVTAASVDALEITNTSANDNHTWVHAPLGNSDNVFNFLEGQKLDYTARFKVAHASSGEFVMGLQDYQAGTSPLYPQNGIYFKKEDGSAQVNLVVRRDSASVAVKYNVASVADDTWIELRFVYPGYGSELKTFVNGSPGISLPLSAPVAGTTIANYNYTLDGNAYHLETDLIKPSPTDMSATFGIQNGSGVTQQLTVDYVTVAQEN